MRAALFGRLKPSLALGVIVLPVLTHRALGGGWPPALTALLVGAQTLVLAALFSARLPMRWRTAFVIGFASLAAALAFHWGRAGLSLTGGLTHAAINVFLLGLFASSLAPGREPLIATFARHIHNGVLPVELEAHARLETRLWCGFFLAQLLGSILLYTMAPLSVWSFFITILNPILLVAMFVGATVYRRWRYRHLPQSQLRHLVRMASAWRAVGKAVSEPEGSR